MVHKYSQQALGARRYRAMERGFLAPKPADLSWVLVPSLLASHVKGMTKSLLFHQQHETQSVHHQVDAEFKVHKRTHHFQQRWSCPGQWQAGSDPLLEADPWAAASLPPIAAQVRYPDVWQNYVPCHDYAFEENKMHFIKHGNGEVDTGLEELMPTCAPDFVPMDSMDTPETLLSVPDMEEKLFHAPLDSSALGSAWCLSPSVGAWLHALPLGGELISVHNADNCESFASEAYESVNVVEEKVFHAEFLSPSIGSCPRAPPSGGELISMHSTDNFENFAPEAYLSANEMEKKFPHANLSPSRTSNVKSGVDEYAVRLIQHAWRAFAESHGLCHLKNGLLYMPTHGLGYAPD